MNISRGLKLGLGIIGLLIVLIVIAVGALLSIDPNTYKDKIEQLASEQLDANLSIGAIKWDLWPRIGLMVNTLELRAPKAQMEHQQLVAVEQASIDLALLPLLRGAIEMSSIRLIKPQIWFHQNADQSTNWDSILAKFQTQDENEKQPDPNQKSAELPELHIEQVQIVDGQLDTSGAMQANVDGFSLTVNQLGFNQPVELLLSAAYKADTMSYGLNLKSTFNYNTSAERINLNNTSLVLTDRKLDQELKVLLDGSYDLANGAAQLDPLKISTADFKLVSQLQANQLNNAKPNITWSLPNQTLNLQSALQAWGIITVESAADSPTRKSGLERLAVQGQINLTDNQIDFRLDPMNVGDNKGRLNAGYNLDTSSANFDAYLAKLDVTPFMQNAEQTSAEQTSAAANQPKTSVQANASSQTPLPLELIKTLKLNGQLVIDQLLIRDSNNKLAIKALVQNGRVKIEPLEAKAFDGSLQIRADLNANTTPAQLKMSSDLSQFAVHKALKTFLFDPWLEAAINSTISLTSKGDTVESLLANLNGGAELKMADATLPKLNLQQVVLSQLDRFDPQLSQLLKDKKLIKTPKVFRETTQFKQFFAKMLITPEAISSDKITGSLNGEPFDGSLAYNRSSGALTLNTTMSMP